MNRRNFSNVGDEIKDIVQNAVNSNEFRQLNKNIENTVNQALFELRKSLGNTQNSWEDTDDFRVPYGRRDWDRHNRRERRGRNEAYDIPRPYVKQTWDKKKRYEVSPDSIPVGRVSGTLFTVFGSIGISLFGIAILVLGILGFALHMGLFFTISAGLLPLLIGSIFLSARGGTVRKRLKRFRQYLAIMKDKNYCMIKELANRSGYKESFILKDLRKMFAIGMFPQGHIDEQQTCFMLNGESYEQYLKLQESLREQKQHENMQETRKTQTDCKNEAETSKFKTVIEEGKAYVRQIREANNAIPGEEISRKLYRLESVTSKIFDYVQLHPEQLSDIAKFMEYYLPTTAKLLNAYREFELQPIQGENIATAKKEIENTLDTINLAFEKLLDSLFQDTAMDVSTDISVLNTMLKQEGLTEKDFK